MLGKLFKHEMKATTRVFAPLLAMLFGFTIISTILYSDTVRDFFWGGRFNWITGIVYFVVSAIYGILIGAVFVATLLVLIQRFYKNLLGDEGYLMNTLPVKPWQHITAKMLTGTIWSIINSIAAILAIMILALAPNDWLRIWPEFWKTMQWVAQDMGMPTWLYTLEIMVSGLICTVGGMLPIYAAISVGQCWKKHKIMGAIVVYIGGGTVFSIIFVKIMEFIANNIYYMHYTTSFHIVLWVTTALTALVYAACFWYTNRHLTKHLNLE